MIMNDRLKQTSYIINDPSEPQIRAADPSRHVWVRASAGSGKTKVLVDRVLRLLLPDPLIGRIGSNPERILCLTFTKAGATNMSLRIQEKLLEWSVLPIETLYAELKKLFGRDIIEDEIIKRAQELFAIILDRPDRLRILTIHSFCQSILARFPLETGLSPSVNVADEAIQVPLKQKAVEQALSMMNESILGSSLYQLFLSQKYEDLSSELFCMLPNIKQYQALFEVYSSKESLYNLYAETLDIDLEIIYDPQTWFYDWSIKDKQLWSDIAKAYEDAGTEPTRLFSLEIKTYIDVSAEERIQNGDEIIKLINANPRNTSIQNDGQYNTAIEYMRNRLEIFRKASEAQLSIVYLILLREVDARYKHLKSIDNTIDYHDLIYYTQTLLNSSLSWVHYKLDGGIDHILVDESQDTSPEQWNIIEQLSSEMFSQDTHQARERTLFVVGDEKQSIFSFQGADPAVFHKQLKSFREKIAPLQDGLEEELIYSFRTTAPVLDLVDATFDDDMMRQSIGLQDKKLLHHSYRALHKQDQSGGIELWLETDDTEKKQKELNPYSWKSPFLIDNTQNKKDASHRLLEKIVLRIKTEIQSGNWKPEDILILFRTRNQMMNNLIKMLKWENLPVSGIDRLILNDHIVIKDILALAQFLITEEDDFSLACFLKSPFVGLTEDQLFDLAYGRKKSETLYGRIKTSSDMKHIAKWLDELRIQAEQYPVYECLMYLLTKPCPADQDGSGYRAAVRRFGLEIMEPLDEILGDALRLELQNIRTLQDFITRFTSGKREIKRELSKTMGEIRIMTVHASKGLEAEVVFLPDTIKLPDHKKTSRFMSVKTKYKNIHCPLYRFLKENSSKYMLQRMEQELNERKSEEHRLLYVAMTRARDILIVGGAYKKTQKNPEPKSESWFGLVQNGMEKLGILANENDRHRIYGQSLTLISKQEAEPMVVNNFIPPSWLFQDTAAITKTDSILNPSLAKKDQKSRRDVESNSVLLPHKEDQRRRFLRGTITHKLLQMLPLVEEKNRESVALSYVSLSRFAISESVQRNIVDETLTILNLPTFANVFGKNSMAEVPIMGRLLDGQYVSGQIDRLYIGDNEILVVDFKTNRPSPDDPSRIPEEYRAQMALYKALLSELYPQKTIRTALLWTDTARLMALE
jgi:ATP-dependent helicase/nuclease subunit A